MEDKNLQPSNPNLLETMRVPQEIREQFRALFKASIEKIKEYGVNQGILDPDIPLEQVRPKILEYINERKAQRRAGDRKTTGEEQRILEDRRQS